MGDAKICPSMTFFSVASRAVLSYLYNMLSTYTALIIFALITGNIDIMGPVYLEIQLSEAVTGEHGQQQGIIQVVVHNIRKASSSPILT